jgi:hypothetical protein
MRVKLDGVPTPKQKIVIDWLGEVEERLQQWTREERGRARRNRKKIAAALAAAATADQPPEAPSREPEAA